MARQLTANVVVSHPESGDPELLLEGSDLPEWAKDIVGDHVLSGSPGKDSETESGPPDQGAGAKLPPQQGAGSSKAKWSEYAAAHGVKVDEGMSRDDIVAACHEADVPVE